MITIKNFKSEVNPKGWITKETVLKCFKKGTRHHINKVLCGNGFTFAFLSIAEQFAFTDVLIEANKNVVKDKEIEYKEGKFGTKKMLFLYEGSGNRYDSKVHYDKIICVVDSFNHNYYQLKKSTKIRFLLVDEMHSIESMSSQLGRQKQSYNFYNNLEHVERNGGIVSTVTASPNVRANISIEIDNGTIEIKHLNVSFNDIETINRIVERYKRGERSIIFSNSSVIAARISKACNEPSFNLISGDTFKAGLVAKGEYFISKYNEDKMKQLTFVTSTGYEGWSCHLEGINVFCFTAYNSPALSMKYSNIYQAINRPRQGAAHQEVCIYKSAGYGYKYMPHIDKAVNDYVSSPLKVQKKQKKDYELKSLGATYTSQDFKPFTLVVEDNNYDLVLIKLQDSVNHHLELYESSLNFMVKHGSAFLERGVKLVTFDESSDDKAKRLSVKEAKKISNLIHNLTQDDTIIKMAIYPHNGMSCEKGKERDKLEQLLRIGIAVKKGIGLDASKDINTYNLIRDKDLNDILKNQYLKDSKGKYKRCDSLKYWEDHNIQTKVFKAIYELMRGYPTANIVGHRDYNVWVSISMGMINLICKKMGLNVVEMDIKEAYPRLIYAKHRIEFPLNFYGGEDTRSKTKIAVNSILNSLHIPTADAYRVSQHRKGKVCSVSQAKKYVGRKKKEDKSQLKKYFPVEIVNDLSDTYSNKGDKGSFADDMAKEEKIFIRKLADVIKNENNPENREDINYFSVRRHDSIICISDNTFYLETNNARDIEYKGSKGWVKVKKYYDDDSNELLLDFYAA